MSTEEIFKQSGYPQPQDKFDESKKQFDYWDMLAFADLVVEKQVKNNDLLHSVSDCSSTLEDTIDLIEHTSRVLDAYKEKGIAMKVLDKRVKAKLNYLHKLYSR